MSLSVTRWGDPNATKHALLIHGLVSSSGGWFRVAQGLVDQGYYVTAPDLLGHGKAPRSTDCTLDAFAKALEPLFEPSQPRFSLVIAHSFGGVVALRLLPCLASSDTVPVILLDPPLLPPSQTPAEQQFREGVAVAKGFVVKEATEVPSVEELQAANPLWTREDAEWKVSGAQDCDPIGLGEILEQNFPWSFVHLLSLDRIPPNIRLLILGADPDKHPAFRAESIAKYDHVQTQVVEGATHSIHREYPHIVVSAAMRAVEEATVC